MKMAYGLFSCNSNHLSNIHPLELFFDEPSPLIVIFYIKIDVYLLQIIYFMFINYKLFTLNYHLLLFCTD